jgi:hypothetical protein
MSRTIAGVAHLFGPGGINPETFEPQPTIGQERRAAQAALHQHYQRYDSTTYKDRMSQHRPPEIIQAEAYPFDTLPSLQQQPQQPKEKSSLKTNDHTGIHKPKHEKKRPPALNIGLTQYGAPNLRAAEFARQNGEDAMSAFAKEDPTNPANFDLTAPENFGDNPDYDQANKDRWHKPFGGRTKKRRNTRRRSHKYKPKRKQQTRKKTFRKRK